MKVTPQDTFNAWNEIYHFTMDVCALSTNAKCAQYFTPEQDGLQQDWGSQICWCNPPYTARVIDRWVRKAFDASKAGATVVCLLPVSTTATWWKDYVKPKLTGSAADVVFLDDRQKFSGSNVDAPFDTCVIFRPPNEI